MKRAFTLIELLVVIAIIGILASVVVVNVGSSRIKARDAKRISDLKAVQTALEMYYDQNGTYPLQTGYSAWEHPTRYSDHTANYWSTGWESNNTVSSKELYNALVVNGYLSSLPLDPVNFEGGGPGYLIGGAQEDTSYFYTYSYTPNTTDSPQGYLLGTNLETTNQRNYPDGSMCGNYQIKVKPPTQVFADGC